jgi:hypothetical protein
LCAPELIRGSGKETDPVNAVAVMYVNSHLADLQAEARRDRAASLIERRTLRERLTSSAASLRKVLGSDSGPVVPQLKNYPYGG